MVPGPHPDTRWNAGSPIVALSIDSGALPLLRNATDFGADDALSGTDPKSTECGSWHTYGALTPAGKP
jgi:hypothetical protein